VSNRDGEKVKVRISDTVRGDSSDTEVQPNAVKTAQGQSGMNPMHDLEQNV